MKTLLKTAIIIPTYNAQEILEICLKNLKKIKYSEFFDIYVIDNGSVDNTRKTVARMKHVKYFALPKNYFASLAINKAFSKFLIEKNYKYILIMAQDVKISSDLPYEMVKYFESNKKIGLLGAIQYEYGTNIVRTTGHNINHLTSTLINFIRCSGENKLNHFSSLYMIKSKLFGEVGQLDDVLFPMIFEEPDIGERIIRSGHEIRCCPRAKIWHPIETTLKNKNKIDLRLDRIYSNSAKTYLFFRNRLIYMSLYAGFISFLFFFFFIEPFIVFFYIKNLSPAFYKSAVQGLIDGSIFAFTKSRQYIKIQNNKVLKI